jgi:hypothetical protein
MYTVSLDKETLNITIRNLHPDLELTSPVYFSTNTTYCVPPSQQADTGITIEASFGIDYKQKCFKGALLHKLQKKRTTRNDDHLNSSTAFIKDIAKNVYLLALWNVENCDNRFRVCLWNVLLIPLGMKTNYGHYIVKMVLNFIRIIMDLI